MTVVLEIVAYERKYRDDILSLMFYSRHTHTHLDWYKAGQWLDLEGNTIGLAFHQDDLVGVMGISEALNEAVWLRLMVIAQGYDPAMILSFLWGHLRPVLIANRIKSANILVINPWLASFLPALSFQYLENVISMHRAPQELPAPPQSDVMLRNGYLEDIHAIVAIDHSAFDPPWQMSATDIRFSQRQAANCTLAIYDNQVVGYEIATRHHTAGHLARLAVYPQIQGKRVGQVLLHHLLTRFSQRGVKGMTVNTQESNIRSQRLYERFGFLRNGFDLSVWTMDL